MEDNHNISKSKASILVATTALVCIIATGYVSNYLYKQKFAQYVFTFNIADAQYNVQIARKLRNGNTEKVIKFMDSTTGSNAITFTNYKIFAPKNLHHDIAETLAMIKKYREEFKIQSTLEDQQKDIDKSLAQIN